MYGSMTFRVALVGPVPGRADGILEGKVHEEMTFMTVPDPTDEARVREVFARADAVVGDWPPVPVEAEDVRLVQRWGAGMDKYDPDTLPAGAFVCNVYQHGESIAEHSFALLLSLFRRVIVYDRDLRQGHWNRPRAPGGDTRSLKDKTLGSIGFGTIGQSLLRPAKGFGMRFIAIQASNPESPPPDGVAYLGGSADLSHLLEESDAVVVAVPLTDETRGLIGTNELLKLGGEGVLINVSRGPVVDEAALYEALDSGTIAGAGIDTWYNYPATDEDQLPSSYPFHELDNVVMTPHVGGWDERTADSRWTFIAANLDRVARGERPENVVWEL